MASDPLVKELESVRKGGMQALAAAKASAAQVEAAISRAVDQHDMVLELAEKAYGADSPEYVAAKSQADDVLNQFEAFRDLSAKAIDTHSGIVDDQTAALTKAVEALSA